MKCIKCGENFTQKDKRVKTCDKCRNKDNKKLDKDFINSMEKLKSLVDEAKRRERRKKILIVSILVAIEVVNLLLIFVK